MSQTPLKHDELSGVTEDQHHPKKHNLSSTVEHIGQLPESRIAYPSPPLHSHEGKIKVRAEVGRDTQERPLVEFRGNGSIGVTVVDGAQYNKAIVTISGNDSVTYPAYMVMAETAYGISPSVGTGSLYAREDHNHGTPAYTGSATTVVSELINGITPTVGTSSLYARADHTHGTPAYDEFLLQEFFIESGTANMHRWNNDTYAAPIAVTGSRSGLSYPSGIATDFNMKGYYFKQDQNLYVRFRIYKTDYNAFAVIFSDSGVVATNAWGILMLFADESINGFISSGGVQTITQLSASYVLSVEHVMEFWLDSSDNLQVSLNGGAPTDCGNIPLTGSFKFNTYGGPDGVAPDETIFRNLTIRADWSS